MPPRRDVPWPRRALGLRLACPGATPAARRASHPRSATAGEAPDQSANAARAYRACGPALPGSPGMEDGVDLDQCAARQACNADRSPRGIRLAHVLRHDFVDASEMR